MGIGGVNLNWIDVSGVTDMKQMFSSDKAVLTNSSHMTHSDKSCFELIDYRDSVVGKMRERL